MAHLVSVMKVDGLPQDARRVRDWQARDHFVEHIPHEGCLLGTNSDWNWHAAWSTRKSQVIAPFLLQIVSQATLHSGLSAWCR